VSTRLFLLSLVIGLLLAEARLSARHTAALRRRGAIEPPGDVYAALGVSYVLAFLLMGAEGLWRQPGTFWLPSGVLLFAASKGLKYWAIGTLGERWSFRVLILPGVPLVTTGPYRYVEHPNYIAVVGELVGAAMMFGAAFTGPVTIGLFGIALWARVRFETTVLRREYRT
jgi:methyltransferase